MKFSQLVYSEHRVFLLVDTDVANRQNVQIRTLPPADSRATSHSHEDFK